MADERVIEGAGRTARAVSVPHASHVVLTALNCETLPDGKYSDAHGLRLTVRGATRAWTLLYTSPTNGKRRELGLGTLAEVGLAKARKLAAAARDKVRQDVDPLDEREQKRAVAAAAEAVRKEAVRANAATLRRVVRAYHESKVEPVLTDKHAKQWLASIENHVPTKLLDAPIATIEPAELLDALQPLYVQVPETGRRVRQRLDAVFDHAVLRKLAPTNPAKIIVRELRHKRERSHLRALPFADVPALVSRLRPLPGTAARALEFAVLTGARTAEVLGMTWSELSADGKTWTVPAERMKAKEAHAVYLSEPARAVLAKVRKLSSTWVFRSPVPERDAPLSNMAMLILLRRLEIADKTTVHGLARSCFSTWANETGAARPDVVEACLAHREGDRVKAAYNRAKFADERKALLAAWAAFVTPSKRKAKGGRE